MMKFTVLLCAFAVIGTYAQSQDPAYRLLEQIEYVNRVLYKLLMAHLSTDNIPEPMVFDNFTYNHTAFLKSGQSNTYESLLHGYSDSRLDVDVTEDTFEAELRLSIPEAVLTGRYDLWIDEILILPPYFWRYRGNGIYDHTFRNVELLVNFTIERTEDDSRTVPRDVHTRLSFENCTLWAENFEENGAPWEGGRWFNQSILYKRNFDSDARRHDIFISEVVSSYFGSMWGILNFTKDQARESLLAFGGKDKQC